MNKSFSSVFLKFLGKKSIGRRFIKSVIFVCMTLILWVTTMLFLYKELKKLIAVARVEHIDVTIIPETLNEIARNFTTYLFFIIFGILSLLIYRFYQETIAEKNYLNESSEKNKQIFELKKKMTYRLVKYFIVSFSINIVLDIFLCLLLIWTTKPYFS